MPDSTTGTDRRSTDALERRRLLATLGAASTVGLAGCFEFGGGEGEDEEEEGGEGGLGGGEEE